MEVVLLTLGSLVKRLEAFGLAASFQFGAAKKAWNEASAAMAQAAEIANNDLVQATNRVNAGISEMSVQLAQANTLTKLQSSSSQQLSVDLEALATSAGSSAAQIVSMADALREVQQVQLDISKQAQAELAAMDPTGRGLAGTRKQFRDRLGLTGSMDLSKLGDLGQGIDQATRKAMELGREMRFATEITGDLQEAAQQAGMSLFQGFGDAILQGQGFSAVLKGIISDLQNIASRLATKILSKVLGGALGFLGFQHGGEPPVGRPSIVGEAGPELFVPKTAGTIVPNSLLRGGAGGGGGNTYNIDARGAAPGMENKMFFAMRQLMRQSQSGAVRQMRDNMLRSG